jgi:hypothetical protein
MSLLGLRGLKTPMVLKSPGQGKCRRKTNPKARGQHACGRARNADRGAGEPLRLVYFWDQSRVVVTLVASRSAASSQPQSHFGGSAQCRECAGDAVDFFVNSRFKLGDDGGGVLRSRAIARRRAMARASMPAKPCVRCKKPTRSRHGGRPTCFYCRVHLDELRSDNEMRRMGRLKGTRGCC